MLKFGEKIISDIYLGDKKIAKAFLGDKLVYQANKPIFLDYIHFGGASYIDTGIAYQTCTVKTAVKYEANKGRRMLTGFASSGSYWGMTTDGLLELSGKSVANTNLTDYTDVEFKVDATNNMLYCKADGVEFESNTVATTDTYTIGCTNPTSSNKIIGNVYYSTFYNADGTLIQDLRPCIDPKGTVCMYDMVTKKYFYNQGTGTLTAGNKIKFVDYIEFDGASYIDTGIIGRSGISAEYNVYIPSSNIETANVLITGSRISSGDTRFFLGVVIHPYGKCWGLGIGTDYYQAKNIPTGDKYYYVQANTSSSGGELIVDGETVATTTATIDTGLNMYMGGVNNYGTPRLTGSEGLKFTYYKLYHDGTLIQDLRPCVVAGEACFYDMVTGKIFNNAGTGTLKASGRFVESIVFDGASYIKTGVAYQDCTVECGLICPATSDRKLMGWGSTASTYWGITNGQFELGGGFVLTESDTTKYSEVKIEVAISDRRYLTLSHAGNSINRAGNVGGGTYNYAIGAMPNSYTYGFIGNIYFHRFINPDGVLMQDLRPYVDENGTACFKDIVTGKLFYNQGTGTLEYTEG